MLARWLFPVPFVFACACSSTPDAATPTSTAEAGTAAPAGTGSAASSEPSAPANDPAMTATGPKAPDFTLPAIDGSQVSLADFHGKKVVVLDFWSTTCDPCMAEMPHLVDLYKRYKDRGLVVLAISLDGPESLAQVNSVVHDKGMIFPVLLDAETEVVNKYDPKKEMPYSAVVAKNGVITMKHGAYNEGDEKLIEAAVAKLIP